MFNFFLMNDLKIIKSRKKNKNKIISNKLYKGACVKIENSQKTFQVVGINPGNKICWVREWPFAFDTKKTFALKISQITLQIFCSNLIT